MTAGAAGAGVEESVKPAPRPADHHPMAWWVWMLVGWVLLAPLLAVAVGRFLRDAGRIAVDAPPAPRPRRRRIPVPPVSIALGGIGVALESGGLLVRTTGHELTLPALSMDHPLSVPRMWVAGLFAVAALAAFAGAVRLPHRRPWWIAVGLVAALVAEVKAAGTAHVRAVAAVGLAGHPVVAGVASAAVLLAVLAVLRWISRDERRDRRRALTAFGLYGFASVGLSAVSSIVAQHTGSSWAAAVATFVEESGESLGAVAVLTAVLVGVAPRLVLPADWALRRRADEPAVAPSVAPAWTPPGWR